MKQGENVLKECHQERNVRTSASTSVRGRGRGQGRGRARGIGKGRERDGGEDEVEVILKLEVELDKNPKVAQEVVAEEGSKKILFLCKVIQEHL